MPTQQHTHQKSFIEHFLSAIVLIASNSIPLFGVMLYGWNTFTIMLAYWTENVVIGMVTVLKMMKAQGSFPAQLASMVQLNGVPLSSMTHSGSTNTAERVFLIPFFTMHFGLFTLVHGIFVIVMFFSPQASILGIVLSFISLCLSHLVSYKTNFIARGEYKKMSPMQLFIAPYPRIIVMHLTVILGGFFALSHQSTYAVAVLVILKTVVDLFSHFFEHRKLFFTT